MSAVDSGGMSDREERGGFLEASCSATDSSEMPCTALGSQAAVGAPSRFSDDAGAHGRYCVWGIRRALGRFRSSVEQSLCCTAPESRMMTVLRRLQRVCVCSRVKRVTLFTRMKGVSQEPVVGEPGIVSVRRRKCQGPGWCFVCLVDAPLR